MAKVLVNESSLTGIADAIRSKNGSTDTYKPSQMAAAISAISGAAEPVIEALSVTANGTYTAPDGVDGYSPVTVNVPQDGSPPDEAFVISGDCSYRFANNGWDWFIELYGNKITTQNIIHLGSMFYESSDLISIPFEINCSSGKDIVATYMFAHCYNLRNIPKINNLRVTGISSLFNSCNMLRNIPDTITSTWDWNYLESQTSAYNGDQSKMFYGCFSLRSIPMDLISHGNPKIYYGYSYFNNGFYYCYVLDELINLPIPYTNVTWTSNAFTNTFYNCYRLKNITFALNDGQPYVMKWKSQTIDLSNVGSTGSESFNRYIVGNNSGITDDKLVSDDLSYQNLKNDTDWYAHKMAYSRYNHDSAVATINSLPDTSAYLASAGGTNTIKFRGAAGSATDGGAISSLTPEEIAVATSRGWTVSLT